MKREKRYVAPELLRELRKDGTRRTKVPHMTREELRGAAHVVLRLRRGLPSHRTPRAWRVLEGAIRASKGKVGFRVCEFSVQRDHIHLVVEADDRWKLTRGMQGLMIRIAKRLNRLWNDREGSVFAERYFSLAIKKYSQLRRTVIYVVNNGRKHGEWTERGEPDPFSSGRWFRHWASGEAFLRALRDAPVEPPRTYEIFAGFEVNEVPGRWSPSGDVAELLAS